MTAQALIQLRQKYCDSEIAMAGCTVYRSEKPEYLIAMLRDSMAFFVHPSLWQDQFESELFRAGKVLESKLVQGPDGRFYSNLPPTRGAKTKSVKSTNCMGRYVFAQCFDQRAESERIWAAYSDRLRWSVDLDRYMAVLVASAPDQVFHRVKVDYLPEDEVKSIHGSYVEKYSGALKVPAMQEWCNEVAVPLRAKRADFDDESEHRVILIDKRTMFDPRNDGRPPERRLTSVSVPMRELIEEVTFPPNWPQEGFDQLSAELREAGFPGSIRRSTLFAAPNMDQVRSKHGPRAPE